MTAQRIWLLATIVFEAAVAGYFFGYAAAPALIVALAAIGVWGRIQRDIIVERKIILALGMAAAVAVYWRTVIAAEPSQTLALQNGLGFGFAVYAMLFQTSLFFVRIEPARVSAYSPFCTAVVLGSCGDFLMLDTEKTVYQTVVLLSMPLIAGILSTGRKPAVEPEAAGRTRYRVAVATVLVLSLALGSGASYLLKHYQTALDTAFVNWVAKRINRQAIGFPSNASLTSVAGMRDTDSDAVALRVYSQTAPGYLRGKTYDGYDDGHWNLTEVSRAVLPSPGPVKQSRDERYFALRRGAARGKPMEVWPEIESHSFLFTPLDTPALAAPLEELQMDVLGNFSSPKLKWNTPYTVYTTDVAEPVAPGETPDARYTQVTDKVSPEVRQLAAKLFESRASTEDKVDAVVGYFRDNYKYALDIMVPWGHDPLNFFLLEHPAAHCEYFASGAAILLRLGGVPTRYVTGFVAEEASRFGGFWIARNKDAHAWVEAYDAARGWFTVEPTVAPGTPDGARRKQENILTQLIDYVLHRYRTLRTAFDVAGLKGLAIQAGVVLGALLQAIASNPIVIALALAAAVYQLYRRLQRPKKKVRPIPPRVINLNRLLERMDRHVQQHGVTRRPAETLHQFAHRIARDHPEDPALQSAAAWYIDYATIRFQATGDEKTDLDRLATAIKG